MNWGEVLGLVFWLGGPVGLGVAVGEAYRIILRAELAEAKRIADKTYLELDKTRFEIEELQTVLDRARGGPSTEVISATSWFR